MMAVSYTHLDVYKRQVEDGITKVRNIITYNLRGVMEICRLSQAKFGLGRTVGSKLSGVQSWMSHFTTLFPAGIVSPEGVHSVGSLISVSYTHLFYNRGYRSVLPHKRTAS